MNINFKFMYSYEDCELSEEIGTMLPFSFSKQINIETDLKKSLPS